MAFLFLVYTFIDERHHGLCFENLKKIIIDLRQENMIDSMRKIKECYIDLRVRSFDLNCPVAVEELNITKT